MKHATMCNLFFVILKRFFVKTETGRKPIEVLLCLESNPPQVPMENQSVSRNWIPRIAYKNVRSVILGVVGILRNMCRKSLVIHDLTNFKFGLCIFDLQSGS